MNKYPIENRGENNPPQKKSFSFKNFSKNTCCSLNDVECFLNNFTHYYKYVRLYKLLR